MIDPSHDHRIEMLERMLQVLTEGAGGMASGNANGGPDVTASEELHARIDTLETMMLALTNSVVMLNQRVAHLGVELSQLSTVDEVDPARPMTIDASQDVRLDTLESMVHTLRAGITDYDRQMAEIVARYKARKVNRARSGTGSQDT